MKSKSVNINTVIKDNEVNIESIRSQKIDINKLLLKVRLEEKKEKKENIVFLGLIGSVVISLGIIATL
jgi:hypothetical protein